MIMKNIAIFASGEGTNAQHIIDYFKNSTAIKVSLVVSNKSTANVLNRAKESNIPALIITKEDFYESDKTIEQLTHYTIDVLILAGFLWMIPESLIKAFPDKIINIHPALLPKFGGKGMYGMNVHKAVIDSKEKESGITIHYVNEKYDEGKLIFQHTCVVCENETPESLAQKIQRMEHVFFPREIERLMS